MNNRTEKLKKFYNNKIRESQEMRKNSPLIGVRKFNNEVKSFLITETAKTFDRNIVVLDLCGGQGGDYPKFQFNKNVDKVYLVDISANSVEEAKKRYAENAHWRKSFDAFFYCGDAFSEEMLKILPLPKESVDLINCQFAFHYAFESKEKATQAFGVISHFLKKGGKCVMTFPNAEWIQQQNSQLITNGAFIIKFTESTSDGKNDNNKRERKETDNNDFGQTYTFSMGDSVVDVPEYLVKKDVFQQLCLDHSLSILKWMPFRTYYANNSVNGKHIDETAWDTAQLYLVVEIEKK